MVGFIIGPRGEVQGKIKSLIKENNNNNNSLIIIIIIIIIIS
jgi:hypothetical protein